MRDNEAMKEARADIERSEDEPLEDSLQGAIQSTDPYHYPPPVRADMVLLKEYPERPFLINNLLRKGDKTIIAGQSKAGKTWMLMQIALCIAAGLPLFGREHLTCTPAEVLYINLELPECDALNRFRKVAKSYDIDLSIPEDREKIKGLHIWNLRETKTQFKQLRELTAEIENNYAGKILRPVVVIIDPIYKSFTGDEISQKDVAENLSLLDELSALGDGVTVIYSHHYSKGAQAGKFAMDRASGSGVFSRDADLFITLDRINDEEIDNVLLSADESLWRFEVAACRSIAPFTPMGIRFSYPRHYYEPGLETAPLYDPSKKALTDRNIRQSARKDSSKQKLLDFVYGTIEKEGRPPLRIRAEKHLGISERSVRRYIEEMPEIELRKGTGVNSSAKYIVPSDYPETEFIRGKKSDGQ